MTAPFTLTVLGGGREVGANCYHLGFGDGRGGVLLDAGMHPKRQGTAALPDFAAAGEVDAIVVSHAHLDHVGALPVALQRFPRVRVHTTGPTALLALRMLRNAVAVMRGRGGVVGAKPLYGADEVEWLEQVLVTHEPGRSFVLEGAGTRPRAVLYSAGHLLGAAGVLLEHEGRRLFYSGDTCASAQQLLGPARYPSGRIDVLLLDSTHGADPEVDLRRDEEGFAHATSELGAFISEVAARGGSVLLPVFALGRSQEILALLQRRRTAGQIPALPVFVSGLSHAICRIYDSLAGDGAPLLADVGYRLLDPARAADPSLLERPAIYALTSGMMTAGTASHSLARRLLLEERHGLGVVGFLDPETPGYRVAQAVRGATVDLGGAAGLVPVAAEVRRFGFTGHSRASQLLDTVTRLRPRRVVLVHGESVAVETLAERVRALQLPLDVVVGEPGAHLEL